MYEEAGLDNIAIELKVSPSDDESGRGLGSGNPVLQRLKNASEDNDQNMFREQGLNINNNWRSSFTPPPDSKLNDVKPSLLTPRTETTSIYNDDTISLSSTVSSTFSYDANPMPIDLMFRHSKSLHAGTPALAKNSGSIENLPVAPSPAMRDQLKYYMKKHTSPENKANSKKDDMSFLPDAYSNTSGN